MKANLITALLMAALASACGGDSRPQANAAPSISAIADQTTVANQASQPFAFTVSDDDPNALSISATSENQQIVPDSGLILSGTGGNRTVTAVPVNDEVGDTFISIVVADQQGLMDGTSFLLTVDPQQKSMLQFARDTFAETADDEPALINAVVFDEDAADDDFADLLAQ